MLKRIEPNYAIPYHFYDKSDKIRSYLNDNFLLSLEDFDFILENAKKCKLPDGETDKFLMLVSFLIKNETKFNKQQKLEKILNENLVISPLYNHNNNTIKNYNDKTARMDKFFKGYNLEFKNEEEYENLLNEAKLFNEKYLKQAVKEKKNELNKSLLGRTLLKLRKNTNKKYKYSNMSIDFLK